MNASSIEATIDRVEQLYVTVTGRRPPPAHVAPIPPESDLGRLVDDQLDRLAALLERTAASTTEVARAWQPRACAWREDDALVLAIDVPGVTREELEVRLDDRVLVVRGRRTPPWRDRRVEACESPVGMFVRAFPLPMRVEAEHVIARLEAGVLHVRIAPTLVAEPSQIPIRT
jgi:HSP20 family protein